MQRYLSIYIDCYKLEQPVNTSYQCSLVKCPLVKCHLVSGFYGEDRKICGSLDFEPLSFRKVASSLRYAISQLQVALSTTLSVSWLLPLTWSTIKCLAFDATYYYSTTLFSLEPVFSLSMKVPYMNSFPRESCRMRRSVLPAKGTLSRTPH